MTEYRAWYRSDQRSRLAACFLTFTIALLSFSHFLQVIISFHLFPFSFKNIAYTGLFLFSQLTLICAQSLILSAEPKTDPWLLRLKFYLTSPMHVLVAGLFPLSLIGSCHSLLELTKLEISPLNLSVLDHDRACAFGAILGFGIWSAVMSLGRQDMVIVFPSLQQSRWMRLQARLPRLLSISTKNAAKFLGVWYSTYWILSLLFPTLLPRIMSVLVAPLFGPQTFDLSTIMSFSKGLIVFLLLTTVGMCWRLGQFLIMMFSTEVVPFDRLLLFGITDPDRVAQHQAFQCLLEIAELSPKDREGIYDRVQYYIGSDRCWSVVSTQCVEILNEFVDLVCADLTKPVPSGKGWLYRDPRQRTAYLFRDLQITVWSAQILSYLVAFSLEEDEKGCVQQSLPSILAALLDCSIALEEFQKLSKQIANQPQPVVLSQTLDNVIYRITTTFYDQLDNLVLSERHAKRLREFTLFAR